MFITNIHGSFLFVSKGVKRLVLQGVGVKAMCLALIIAIVILIILVIVFTAIGLL